MTGSFDTVEEAKQYITSLEGYDADNFFELLDRIDGVWEALKTQWTG